MNRVNPWSGLLQQAVGGLCRLRGQFAVAGLAVLALAVVLCHGDDAMTKAFALCGLIVVTVVALAIGRDDRAHRP